MKRIVFVAFSLCLFAGSLVPAHATAALTSVSADGPGAGREVAGETPAIRQASRPALACADPTVLTGYHDGIAFPGNLRYNNDVWQEVGKVKASVCAIDDWTAISTQSGPPALGVRAYHAGEFTTTDWQFCSSQPRLDSFTKLKTTFAHAPASPIHHTVDWAFDIFAGSGACNRPLTEIMWFSDWSDDLSLPAPQYTATLSGVPVDIYWSTFAEGGKYIQIRQQTQTLSGKVNWLPVFRYLERKGLLVMSDTMMFLRYGVEVLTTYGQKVPFTLTGFDVKAAF